MLGPTLFLIYINEVTKVVTCEVSLYADDTLLYSEVNNDGDRLRFQAKINPLHAWSSEWKMPFNTDKCVVITFSKGPTADPQYSLECVDQTAYLGIEIQSNLKSDKRITSKIKSASKFLGCIKYSLHEASERGKLLHIPSSAGQSLGILIPFSTHLTIPPAMLWNMCNPKQCALLKTTKVDAG